LKLGGFNQIIAPAGSGKTASIIEIVGNQILLNQNSRIAITVFNDNAANELTQRLFDWLKERGLDGIPQTTFVGTIHSFCLLMLKKNYNPDIRILDDVARKCLVSSKHTYNFLELYKLPKPTGNFYFKTNQNTRRVQTVIDFLKTSDFIRENLLDIGNSIVSEELAHSIILYHNYLRDNDMVDFSGVLFDFFQYIDSNKQHYQVPFDYFVVDEFQDINNIQNLILKEICKDKNLLVVGDDDQNIYKFRGTSPEYFISFKNDYPNVIQTFKDINYRSAESIVKLSSMAIVQNKIRIHKNIIPYPNSPNKSEKSDVTAYCGLTERDELDNIVKTIEYFIGTDFVNSKGEKWSMNYGDICIIARTNKQCRLIAKFLQDSQLKVRTSSSGLLFEEAECLIIVDLIFFVYDLFPGLGDYANDEPLTRMYKDMKGMTKDEVIETDLQSIYEDYCSLFGEIMDFSDFEIGLTKLKIKISKSKNLNIQSSYYSLLNTLGLYDVGSKELENLGQISSMIAEFELTRGNGLKRGIFDFIEFLWGFVFFDLDKKSVDIQIDSVFITTYHRVKGLEFPVVLMPFLYEGNLPSSSKSDSLFGEKNIILNNQSIEDERRLFYVGITRSQKYLVLSFSQNTFGKKRNISSFLNEIKYGELESVLGDEKLKSKINRSKNSIRDLQLSQAKYITYRACPYKYLLNQEIGFRPEFPMVFGFGSAVHSLIRKLLTQFVQQPTDLEIDRFILSNFKMPFVKGDALVPLVSAVKHCVINLFKCRPDIYEVERQLEVNFTFYIDNCLVTGAIDLLESEPNNQITIVDFKTDKEVDFVKYREQVNFYALAISKVLDVQKIKCQIIDLRNAEKEEFYVDNQILLELEEDVKRVTEDILKRNFAPKLGLHCKTCDYNKVCKYYKV
jgi:DNA helicase-2/ATP-dependent DNA helicase PcrA